MNWICKLWNYLFVDANPYYLVSASPNKILTISGPITTKQKYLKIKRILILMNYSNLSTHRNLAEARLKRQHLRKKYGQ